MFHYRHTPNNFPAHLEQEVLWLQVSVHNIHAVAVLHNLHTQQGKGKAQRVQLLGLADACDADYCLPEHSAAMKAAAMHVLPDLSHLQQRAHDAGCIPLPVVALGRQLLKEFAACSSHNVHTHAVSFRLVLALQLVPMNATDHYCCAAAHATASEQPRCKHQQTLEVLRRAHLCTAPSRCGCGAHPRTHP